MIDYRIPGTKIPTLNGMEYGIIHWKEQSFQCSTNKFDGFISYGAINYGGFECIKIEKPNYTRETLLFIVKLKDLQALEAKPASSDNYTYIDPSMLTSLPTDTVIVVTYHSGKVYLNKIARLGSAELKCYIKQDGTRLERGGMTSTDCESLRYATPEEEHWVNMCDSLNRFIPKGEALNSFVPKAVPIEKVIEKIVTVNGYSIEQIEAALNDIPWLEDDDAKELTNELSLRLTKNIAPTKKDLSTIGIQKKPYEFPKIDLPF